ncbi:PCP degradation transcriptional activation protein [Sinobacterium norvegicum]|uniref:PCP degradation transcriptional activation protein n=1 Tax=Sinobacterium norvegicum TaxID=1641715 RepID=A0ABM9ADH9_9GAMM|nr:LysR family transcriptional regulator [Sinobacterium norvegicum]CAH0990998.1 PCP degradation transcriptional activation protein [Sinobacterium norvegicum]
MNSNRLEKLEIHHLKVFISLYQVQNTSKTAESLGLTQSAISRTLKKLRDTFDDPLFIRNKAGLVPTEYADNLYSRLPDALDSLLLTFQPQGFFSPRDLSEELRIALHPSALKLIGPELYMRIKSEAPKVKVRLDNCDSGTSVSLLNGNIHMALNHEILGQPKEIYRENLFTDELCIYARKQHPLATDAHPPKALKRFDLAVCIGTEVEDGMKVKAQAEMMSDIEYSIDLRCGDLQTAVDVISASDTILIGSKMYLACYPNSLQKIDISFSKSIEVPFSISILQKNRNNSLNMWLRKIITEIMAEKVK